MQFPAVTRYFCYNLIPSRAGTLEGLFCKCLGSGSQTVKGLSCNSNLLSDLPLERAIDALADAGYDAVDVCLELEPPFCPIPKPHMSPDDDTVKRDRVRRHAEQAGIAIAALNAHTNLCARDPAVRQANTEFIAGSLQLAADLGAPVVVTAGGGKDAYGYEQWFFDWLFDSLRQVLPIAERLGVSLAIEAGSPAGCLVHDIRTTKRLLEAEGLDSLRLLFDCAHFHVRGDSPVEAFETFRDLIVHMHAKDAAGDPENIIFPPYGEGQIDFDILLGSMATHGFDGYIAVEYEAFAWDFPQDHKQVLAREKAFLEPLIKKHWN